MGPGIVTLFDLYAILPEIALVILAALIMVLDLFRPVRERDNLLGWVTFIGISLIAILAIVLFWPGNESFLVWGGMLRVDSAAAIFRLIILIGAALAVLFSMHIESVKQRGEYFAMLLFSIIGMGLMAAASDLIMLYLAIETTAIPLYVLAGFITREKKSAESGLKYLLFGAMTSAVMLYGFSLLYGFSGSTQFSAILTALQEGLIPQGIQVMILFLVVVGFGFKVSAVPFHFWAPDVYEGSPTPVSGFLSTSSKAAGFIALVRFLLSVFVIEPQIWMLIVAMLATISMLTGNLLAMVQKDAKRLLAFSSISHAGYILIGVASGTALGMKGVIYYLLAYLFTNTAAFGVINAIERETGSSELKQLNGLMKRSPGLALILLVSFLSLAGIPPFGGFISKIIVFSAAVEANMVWLLLVGILNSIIGLYYYLTVLRIAFTGDAEVSKPVTVFPAWKFAFAICVLGIIVLGVIYTPWMNWIGQASTNLLIVH